MEWNESIIIVCIRPRRIGCEEHLITDIYRFFGPLACATRKKNRDENGLQNSYIFGAAGRRRGGGARAVFEKEKEST
jgi:hypothetical protein